MNRRGFLGGIAGFAAALWLPLKAGEFAMFFPPSGGHAAGLTPEKNAEKCRRVTIKVRID